MAPLILIGCEAAPILAMTGVFGGIVVLSSVFHTIGISMATATDIIERLIGG